MKRIPLLLLFLSLSFFRLHAIDSFSFDDEALRKILEAQRRNSQAWASNEAFLETGTIQFDLSRSVLFPQLQATIDGSGSNSFTNRIVVDPDTYELKNKYNLALSPKLSISQLLPSSGVLTGSISDTVSGNGLEESDYPLEEATDIKFSNTLNFSVGIAQPLYFGNAYEASRTQINESREINRITYLDNRNYLITSAIGDYYDLVQAVYQKQLVQARLETNTEYEKRIIREHSLGLWTKAQLNSAKAARLQSEADLLKADQALSLADSRIKTLYGINLNIDLASTNIDMIPFDPGSTDAASLLSEQNPETRISEKQLLIAESDITLEEKDAAFRLNLGSSYYITKAIDDESSSDNLSFSIGLSMPLLDGSASKNSIELKRNRTAKLKTDLNEQRKSAASQLQTYLDNIELRQKLSEIYILQEETAAFDYEKGSRELELGHITQKELLELQIELENTRLSILINRIETNLTVLQTYRLLGFDLSILAGAQEEAE